MRRYAVGLRVLRLPFDLLLPLDNAFGPGVGFRQLQGRGDMGDRLDVHNRPQRRRRHWRMRTGSGNCRR